MTETAITEHLSDLRSIAVPNRSGPSGQASNVYILGTDPVVLIDAGSADPDHTVLTGLTELGNPTVSDIYLTHAHQDHAGGAMVIARETSARIWLPERDLDGAARKHAPDLAVDRWLDPGARVIHQRWDFDVISTPGHAPGHISLCDRETKTFFAGDLISGNGTIAVVPPRGSMSQYVASLYRVQRHQIGVVYPGHGPVIPDGMEVLDSYLNRRISRENGILDLITRGIDSLDELTDEIYGDVKPHLRGLARGTLLAHVIKLVEEHRVTCSTTTDIESARLTVSHTPEE